MIKTTTITCEVDRFIDNKWIMTIKSSGKSCF